MKNEHKYIGKSFPRIDGPAKVTGTAEYVHEMKLPGMLFARILKSPHASAKIKNIDTKLAKKMPGVKAVVTGKELNYKVGSLRKCTYETGQLPDFIKSNDIYEVFITAKLDGMGYVATYVNGTIVSCSTTGNGVTAEDITHSARYVLPNMINIGGAYFFHLGVYGALGIYSIGLTGGVLNGIFPGLKAKKRLPEK